MVEDVIIFTKVIEFK